jgi:SpoVK/Ycf46/Vps4 family AAA+-type ATPase
LAREAERSLIMVDIANIRDKYVGESEKRLKTVFNNYNKACESFEATPILLFNEADALFGKRINVADSVDQMSNAMQNILLQELEDFNGIFMATTNLAASLDPAFERRFLFKVKFDKPAPAVRARIWNEKFKGSVTKATAEKLANEFEFSGGEIDNIAKKALVHEIVMNKKLSYAVLKDFCEHEFLQKSRRANAVGFKL